MEIELTVMISLPDDALEETIDALKQDDSLEGETKESIFWSRIQDWLDAHFLIHTHMTMQVTSSSDPEFTRWLLDVD